MLLVGVVSFAACTPEVDDAFDQSAAERVEMKMKECREVLTSAPNGWRMEYYAARTYGGYNVLCKFEGDNVTVASEKAGSTQNAGVGSDGKVITATSHFSIIQSQGVLLSFDEYNDVFHYFSDPKNPDYGVAGEGMEGDFEFRVVSATPEKVELVGFGTFEVSERAAREGRNPKTGETMPIAACRTPKFKAGKALKDLVNE